MFRQSCKHVIAVAFFGGLTGFAVNYCRRCWLCSTPFSFPLSFRRAFPVFLLYISASEIFIEKISPRSGEKFLTKLIFLAAFCRLIVSRVLPYRFRPFSRRRFCPAQSVVCAEYNLLITAFDASHNFTFAITVKYLRPGCSKQNPVNPSRVLNSKLFLSSTVRQMPYSVRRQFESGCFNKAKSASVRRLSAIRSSLLLIFSI